MGGCGVHVCKQILRCRYKVAAAAALQVRRMHMRFPTLLPKPAPTGAHPVGPPHHWTLLDGEQQQQGNKQPSTGCSNQAVAIRLWQSGCETWLQWLQHVAINLILLQLFYC